ncbi:MAG: DNA-binding response regulator [Sulfobacillus benefaciens]|uniref:Stage 0 sporulation protein A homolog n=1 Tax=Sulfobacillus benefaciens TaxID=453960 RepID=A0A2T2XFW9_9FIRM|nr:MAG: DNA-binding response regulator [Sulfobacillus benefaciens]
MRLRVGIVDDHPVVRDGLKLFLDTAEDIEVTFSAKSGDQALTLLQHHTTDVVLMDLVMPGPMDGLAAIAEIVKRFPAVRILVLTSFQDPQRIRSALKAGAVGYLEKTVNPDELLDAIRQVAWGKSVLEPRVLKVLAEGPRQTVLAEPLTPREQEVLQALGQGLSNKEIAAQLDIAEKTVKVHMSHIFSKLDAYDRTQAVLIAHRLGLLSL